MCGEPFLKVFVISLNNPLDLVANCFNLEDYSNVVQIKFCGAR